MVPPVVIIEIASKINIRNFEQRRLVCEYIEKNADGFFEDHKHHLAKIWGIPVKEDKNDWRFITSFIAHASSHEDLKNGYSGPDGENYEMNWENLLEYRRNWDGYANNINNFLRGNSFPYNRKDIREGLLKKTFDIGKSVANNPRKIKGFYYDKRQGDAKNQLKNFINACVEYGANRRNINKKKADINDFGDLQLFFYLQDKNVLFTYEKVWKEIAQKVCPSNYFSIE